MIKADNLKIEFSEQLFSGLNFSLGNKEKVGLVGLNGCGKSTLLKIIYGLEEPDSGSVILTNEKVSYLPQEFSFPEGIFVGEYYEQLQEDYVVPQHVVAKLISRLGIENIDEYSYIQTRSPGEKMKLYLLKLLLEQPTILLLDEPTNHLDIDGIVWFENFISNFDGICIVISHDREFLDNIANKIFEIDEKQLYVYEGNYTDYLEQKEAFKLERAKQIHLQEKKRERLEVLLANAKKIKDGKKRGKAVQAAKKRMEREVVRNELRSYKEQIIQGLKIGGTVHKSKRIIEIKNLNFGYSSNKPILEGINLQIYGDERIWLYGANGIGKSTLVKLIINELQPNTGSVRWGENLKWKYFSQEGTHLPSEEKLADYFMKSAKVGYDESFGVLEKFLFPKSMRDYPISRLSPGQRSRLSFAIFSQEEYNCIILDEPTNHLDLKTKDVIEQTLCEFSGAIILISHDRAFAKGINPNRIITIENKSLSEL